MSLCTYCNDFCDPDNKYEIPAWVCKKCSRPSCEDCSEDVYEDFEGTDNNDEKKGGWVCNACKLKGGIPEEFIEIEQLTEELERELAAQKLKLRQFIVMRSREVAEEESAVRSKVVKRKPVFHVQIKNNKRAKSPADEKDDLIALG